MTKRDSKSLIMGAARSEFASAGYAGARVERIARKAGVNKQLIFYYFGSKQELYRAAVTTAAREMAIASAPTKDAMSQGKLRDTLEEVFTRLAGRAEVLELLLHTTRAGGLPTQTLGQAFAPPLAQIRDAISAGQGVGLFRDELDPGVLALQATVLLIGYLALEPMLIDADRALTRDAWLAAMSDTLTRAMAW